MFHAKPSFRNARVSAYRSFPGSAHSGLLWLMYYTPRGTVPERESDGIGRSHVWIIAAVVLSFVFV